jgi:hypothetical protein
MRRHTPLADFGQRSGFPVLIPIVTLVATPAAAAPVDSTAAAEAPAAAQPIAAARPIAEQDSVEAEDRWLPVPEEGLESTEALEEEKPRFRSGALLRGAITRGRFEMRRIALLGEGRGLSGELGFLHEEGRYAPGARMTVGSDRLALAGGRVSVSRAPPLFAEAMRITRSGRRVPAPRSGAIAAAPSLGASAGALDGGAIVLRGATSVWAFAGIRSGSRDPICGAGLGIVRGRTRVSAAIGAAGSTRAVEARGADAPDPARCVSITVVRRGRGRSVAVEAVGGSVGRAFLGEATARGEVVLVSARWRYRSWTVRKVAAELVVETPGSDSRARLTWRSWSGNAAADDGLLELEATSRRGAFPVRARLGAVGLGKDRDRAQAREVYGLLDATLARGGGRGLAFHALRRASAGAGSRASSTTVGTRLDVSAGGLGEHSLLVESTRLTSGAPAWGVDFTPSGETTLRTRAKPGMWVAARGGFGKRLWRFGYALQRGEDASGPRPWSGTVWVKLDRY